MLLSQVITKNYQKCTVRNQLTDFGRVNSVLAVMACSDSESVDISKGVQYTTLSNVVST